MRSKYLVATTLTLALALLGCENQNGKTASDSGGTTSVGTGSGGGTGNGGGGVTGGGTGAPEGLECDDSFATPAPGEAGAGSCATGVLSCGDVIEATNVGGSTFFGTDVGEQFWQCSGSASGDDFDGPERVYELTGLSSMRSVTAQLESCEQSWLMWFRTGPRCSEDELFACSPALGTFHDQTAEILLGGAETVWFVVEGNDNDGGNFRLTINCFE